MAMRLRMIEGKLVAVCAAKTTQRDGDWYIDDVADHAIRAKISADNRSEGLDVPVVDAGLERLMLEEEQE